MKEEEGLKAGAEKKSKEAAKKPSKKSKELEKIEELTKALALQEEKYLRQMAEFENYKKRSQKDLEEMANYGASTVVLSLLGVLDNFKRALEYQIDEKDKSFYDGMVMIEKQLLEILTSKGLEKIIAKGEEFNPEFHEGVLNDPVEDDQVGLVTDELQTGYLFNKKVLRPSMVKVGIKN